MVAKKGEMWYYCGKLRSSQGPCISREHLLLVPSSSRNRISGMFNRGLFAL